MIENDEKYILYKHEKTHFVYRICGVPFWDASSPTGIRIVV
jgi:hypothetical protein